MIELDKLDFLSVKVFNALGNFFRIKREAWGYVRWILLTTGFFYLGAFPILMWISLASALCIILFFRDPFRVIAGVPEGTVLCPADGTIVEVSQQDPPAELHLPAGEWHKIGIFLAPWNVHGQRIPIPGTVSGKNYREGEFRHVVSAQTRVENERLSLVVDTCTGEKIVCIQIAGFLARRISCTAQVGDKVSLGQKYGFISFGSRVDLYIPRRAVLFVTEKHSVIAGETVIAFLPPEKNTTKEPKALTHDDHPMGEEIHKSSSGDKKEKGKKDKI